MQSDPGDWMSDDIGAIADPNLRVLRDEALRKIGRNVVLFQQLEGILKFLAAVQHPPTPLSKVTEDCDTRANLIRTQTLGQVAGEVSRRLYSDCDSDSCAPEEINEPWVGFSFRVGWESESIDESRNTLKALIEERNDLVHHLLARWNVADAESCKALSAALDQQRERIVREIETYNAYANTIREMARELKAFIDSDDGERLFDQTFLQQSRLSAVLVSAAKENARADGWTLLSTAGHRLNELIPDEFARLKTMHGEGSLQKLVTAIGLFELASEPTPAGGARMLYRVRIE